MYVRNDMSRDSRVIREARTLVGAGHEVTVMATPRRPDDPDGTREERDGFTVVHVRIPAGRPMWTVWLDRPWKLAGRLVGLARDTLRRPSLLPRAILLAVVLVVSLPWIVVRFSWLAVRGRLRHDPTQRSWPAYLGWWGGPIRGWQRRCTALAPVADVHHAHDLDALEAAADGAERDGAALVYDSHEVFMAWGEHARQPWFVRWLVGGRERRFARRAAGVVTVNAACADELTRRLRPRRMVVVHNCPPRWTPPIPPTGLLRRAAGAPDGAAIVLCHGGFQAGRGLEETAEALTRPGLTEAHLVFLGYRQSYLDPIVADPRLTGRVHVLDPVEPDELLDWVAGADVDVMVFGAVDLNHVVSTPNKLFESLAAGVPVVSSDFPIRRSIVLEDPLGPLGAVCDPGDVDSIAAAIRSILDRPAEERAALRERCLAAAHQRWNWETESERLLGLYEAIA
jgi:glycosyltransferase involved in cell wall biosynthesis